MPARAAGHLSRRALLGGLGAGAAGAAVAGLTGCRKSTRHTVAEPEVHADRRVTFRYNRATDHVSVTGSWDPSAAPQPLSKDDDGGLSATIGPLAPNFYTYSFIVNGVMSNDPANPSRVHSAPALSSFLVPGPGAEFLTPGRGPHGTVSTFEYRSEVTGGTRDATVWLPPGFDPAREYPTLYLLHGGNGDYLDWVQQGCANVILDNLHAAGHLVPMIAVMADGNVGNPLGLPPDDGFASELLDSLVPAIQQKYRVGTGSRARALAGLSLGGLHTWNVLFARPGQIAYIGVFSSGYSPSVIQSLTTQHQDLLRNPAVNDGTLLHRVYLGNRTDVVYADNVKTRAMFDAHRIRYSFQQYDGSGHTWDTWRHHLLDFAPRVFR